ncbi:hypothetical protein [Paenibacillus sp. 1P07SE]|uniref:hypothetical protein n=1 Tax=Paenibacillus sp. 1P07SE TaxID=3132209 RepID=UPI0039A61367
MRKIFIVGIVASGKTTLAKRLSLHFNIPWFELDGIVHHESGNERVKRSPEEQMQVIREINKRQDTWIFEGTDRTSYQDLYDMADTIIFLDPPLWVRRLRMVTRYLKQQLKIEKSNYQSDLKMLALMFKWTNDFERNRQEVERKMDNYKAKVIKITDQRSLEALIDKTEPARWGS